MTTTDSDSTTTDGDAAPYVELPVIDTSTDEGRMRWLLERRNGIGASDVVSIFGLQKDWMNDLYELWLDKTGRVPVDLVSSEAARMGTLIEPVIRAEASYRLGIPFEIAPTRRSLVHPWLRASPDGFGPASREYLECKNTSAYLAADWADEQVPDAAELQVQTLMVVTGAPWVWVAGFIGGNHMELRKVYRDERLGELIVTVTGQYWRDYVLADVEPPIGGSQSTMLAIRDQFTEQAGAFTTDTPNVVRMWADRYTTAQADEKEAKFRKDEARNNIMRLANGHESIVDSAGTVLAKLQRGNFATKRFEAEFPEIADTTRKKVDILDVPAIKAEHPDEYRRHQSLSVRIPKRTTTTTQETNTDGA